MEHGQQQVGEAVDLGAHGIGVAVRVEGGRGGAGGGRPGEVHRRDQAGLVAEGVDLAGAEAEIVAHRSSTVSHLAVSKVTPSTPARRVAAIPIFTPRS